MKQENENGKEEKEPTVLTMTLAEIFNAAGINWQPYPDTQHNAPQ